MEALVTLLVARLKQFRHSFWFIPSLLVVAGVILGEVAVALDRRFDTDTDWLWTPLRMGVDGSRGLLSAIGNSMLAVAATSFSITVSVIATASTSYGPRLVRNFMTDRRNQFVLGQFVATYVYALIVLRSVSSADSQGLEEPFIPYVGVYVAILLALANVMSLVFFIHHVADSIQISHLVSVVRNDLRTAVRRLYVDLPDNAVEARPLTEGYIVTAEKTGFVVSVNEAKLLQAAQTAGGVLEILVPVGHHVIPGEPIARSSVEVDAVRDRIVHSLYVDDARTPVQDVMFAAQQLVEMAVRALSPGTNDPYTARNAIAELGAGLVELAQVREIRAGRTDGDGELRLVTHRVPVSGVIDVVFDDLRTHGATEPSVVAECVRLGRRIQAAATPAVADRVETHLQLMVDALDASGAPAFDVDRVRALLGDDPSSITV